MQPKETDILGKMRKTALTIAALLVGAGLGSYDRLSEMISNPKPGSQKTIPGAPQTGNSLGPGREVVSQLDEKPTNESDLADSTPKSNDVEIYRSGQIQMTPYHSDGVFVGYEVLSAGSDERFRAGDIIKSLNGIPVEDSAAGSELVIAALVSTETRIELFAR